MALEDVFRSYVGVGRVYASKLGATGADAAPRLVGNVSELTFKFAVDSQRERDYTRRGGGTLKRRDQISQVDATLKTMSWNLENWALAAAGDIATVAADATVTETKKGYPGSLILTDQPVGTVASVKVGSTTYATGTDYEVTGAGILLPADSTIPAGSDVIVEFAAPAHRQLNAGMRGATVVALTFDGLNDAENGEAVIVDVWKFSVPPAEQLALISAQQGELSFNGEVLKDGTRGAGESAFFRVRMFG